MNSLKTLAIMAVLAAAGYWMYTNVWQKPESQPDGAASFLSPPNVQIPGLNSQPGQSATATPGGSAGAASTLFGGGAAAASASPFLQPSTSGAAGGSAVDDLSPPPGIASPTLLSPGDQSSKADTAQSGVSSGAWPRISSGAQQGISNGNAMSQGPATTYPAPLAPGSSPAASALDIDSQRKCAELLLAVQQKLDEGKLAEVHLALSSLYDNPDLPQAQARQVTELLDQLAGTVIYSRQHLLEPPYVVRPGDTLDQIAEQYKVPPLLLARINGIGQGQPLAPGRELKVVRGPFSAVVHLEKHELTLMVGGRYAGRFAIGVGCDQPKLEGEYVVREKTINPIYQGPGGVNVPGGDPHNPLGKFWIGLGNGVALHGTVDPQNIGRDDNRGTICLGDRDIDDLYGILSVGSRVVVRR
jgi:lipoprotein-anchoring transpeptidase ErfK/SrfK